MSHNELMQMLCWVRIVLLLCKRDNRLVNPICVSGRSQIQKIGLCAQTHWQPRQAHNTPLGIFTWWNFRYAFDVAHTPEKQVVPVIYTITRSIWFLLHLFRSRSIVPIQFYARILAHSLLYMRACVCVWRKKIRMHKLQQEKKLS